jgi:hypothetical protein
MVSAKSVDDQLKKIQFKRGWNRQETDELRNILIPDEEIFECVNGWYEGGFALLCATDVRVLLIDKKPFKFLTVEDVRFDVVNQIDYSHRLFDAGISITTGSKNLHFRSFNQPRLRKLITHVQHRMAELKRMDYEHKHSSESSTQALDDQLRAYMISQYQQHLDLRKQHETNLLPIDMEVADVQKEISPAVVPDVKPVIDTASITTGVSSSELYEEGLKEIFGKYQSAADTKPIATQSISPVEMTISQDSRDVSALSIAYSKLPSILRSRKDRTSTVTN